MFESEVSFVITSKSLDIARDIAGINSIRGYKLKPRPRVRITDSYYDTKRRLLGRKKIGLRTRRFGGKLLLSMKSNPQPARGMGIQRNEFEAPWSYESLAKISKALRIGPLPAEKTRSSVLEPARVLSAMGLQTVQERRTVRDVRDILESKKSGTRRIAELDIDRVTFLGKPRVRIFEVEIEAKTPGSIKSVQEIAAELGSSYSGFLRIWLHGKLVTGLAIRRLWNEGKLDNYFENGKLKPTAFDLIDKAIVSGQVKGPGI